MTNVLLIGATTDIGEAVRETLLRETDDILTLYAADAGGLNIDKVRESKFAADVSDEDELARAMENQDVIFANDSGEDEDFVYEIVKAMKRTNVLRLILVTSMGIYENMPAPEPLKDNLDYNEMKVPYNKMLSEVEDTNLDYTIIRPGWLREGEIDYNIIKIGDVAENNGVTISSVADFVKRLVQNPTLYSRQSVGIVTPE